MRWLALNGARTAVASRVPWTAVRALCSAAAIAWVLHATPLHAIVAALRQASWPIVLAGMALALLARLAAAERSQVVCRALGLVVSRWQNIETLFISNFYALLSPGPVLGGVVSVYRYSSFGASLSGSIGSLLASRAVEAAVFIIIGTACLLLDRNIALISVRYPLGLAAAGVLAVAAATTCWWLVHQRWMQRGGARAHIRPAGALRAMWHDFMRLGPRMAWRAAIPAAAQVALSGAATCVLARSLGIELSLITAIWVTAAVYAVVLLPISVAGLGVRDLTLIKSLALLGVSSRSAVALSVLLFADPFVNAMIGGALQIRSTIAAARRRRTVPV
ncbi:MAG TPA: lysylphosphatidylglycerol synthase transmembrane domain-containing protein [Steroidobacteraceae bacterium]